MSTDSGKATRRSAAVVDPQRQRADRPPLMAFARALLMLDVAALLVAGAVGVATRPEDTPAWLVAGIGAGIAGVWLITLALIGAYDPRHLGVGAAEFARVLTASLIVLAAGATVGYLAGAENLRGLLLLTVPLALALLLVERRSARAWLHRRRRRGEFTVRALAVGSTEQRQSLDDELAADTSSGLRVVASVTPPTQDRDAWLDEVMLLVDSHAVDAIAVVPGVELDAALVRALAWKLSGTGTDLLVGPSLGDLAGPRAVVRRAPRLPFVHLEEARLTGPQQALKRTGDVLAASLGLVLVFPVMLITAVAVKVSSPGPVLFRQRRIGRDGRSFTISKFRTMADGAHETHEAVLGSPVGRSRDVTFNDPRITPLGRFLRRWSLDEFPQLWSVVKGDMSLVGPRPLMSEEMPWLEPFGQRRHLMTPGITGLWQVNGRKELDWADRIRLDIDYVERWSPLLDVVLLLRTIKVILTGEGAC